MSFFSQLLTRVRSRHVFLTYLTALLVLVLGLQFVVLEYQGLVRSRQSPPHLVQRVLVLMNAAQLLTGPDLSLVTKGPVRQGLHIKLVRQLPSHTAIVNSIDRATIEPLILKSPSHFSISVAQGEGSWLVVQRHAPKRKLLFFGFVLLYVILWLGIFILLWSLVQQFTGPLRQIAKAASRFGVDMQAPPVAAAGPFELQQTVVAFNTMQARVRRLIGDRTQMLAAISHDLRTPITRLQLRLQWMPEQHRQGATDDVNEMDQMIHSILSFARDYNSQEAVTRFDLNALLETICDDHTDLGHRVDYQEVGRVLYDGRMLALKRVFSNLIDNGIKYGERVQVQLTIQGPFRTIKITDAGPGIPETDLVKVFQPFYRVDSARTSGAGGSGLGLAVSRDIVHAHGGDIELHNLSAGGLQVKVTLPWEGK